MNSLLQPAMAVPVDDPHDFLASLRPEPLAMPQSGIDELVSYGRGRQGLMPLWVGEGEAPTPAFICEALTRSLAAGETFYADQRGLPALREAISRYMTHVYGSPFAGLKGDFSADRFYVTIGGMHAIQMAIRLVAGTGDEVMLLTPAWPNFAGALAVAGVAAVEVPLALKADAQGLAWQLDIGRIEAAITPRTRALFVNTPGNPTGWTAPKAELAALLDLARRHGLWIIADEIYGRLTYDQPRAASFHDVMEEHDRVMFVQTCSKNWAMTGLRCGWLEVPPVLGKLVENLILYSSSGVAVPVQRAALAALERGESFVAHQISQFRKSRDILCGGLGASGRARFAVPEAALYVFTKLDGFPDARALALRLVDEANLGVAPGTAFGTAGSGFIRLCFARNPADMAEATRRLANWLAAH